MTLLLVTDVSGANSHAALLDKIGAVDDYFDGIVDAGVIEGVEGFDGRAWALEFPRRPAGSRVASATAVDTFVVKVEREHNRVPAG